MKLQDLKDVLNDEKQLTENGAVGYKTTGKELLDLNFSTSSLRRLSEKDIYDRFVKAFYENKLLAIKWLYFLRDCRSGMGERRSFRAILKNLAYSQPELVKQLIEITAEYGREDDLWCLLDTDIRGNVISYIKMKLMNDIGNVAEGKSISLLGKWLPSSKSKKEEKRRWAQYIRTGLGMSKKQYDKVLKALRDKSNVIETQISRNKWDEVDYSAVPSKANLLYRNAFLRHDEERRREYLDALSKGEAKINVGTLFVHDIIHSYTNSDRWGYRMGVKDLDTVLEDAFEELISTLSIDEDTIVVRDDSGSMTIEIDPKSKTSALEIATALAITFSTTLKGEFKDKYISFSSRPKFIDMSNCKTLKEKLELSYAHSEVSNTNIKATFDLILEVAVRNKYTQDELPKNILIISDMEFDYSCTSRPNEALFEEIARDYATHGYKLPRLVFWNLNSRTGTIPVKQNECGVALVSGFSQNILNMVINGSLDPYQNLVDILNNKRYDAVEQAFNKANI